MNWEDIKPIYFFDGQEIVIDAWSLEDWIEFIEKIPDTPLKEIEAKQNDKNTSTHPTI